MDSSQTIRSQLSCGGRVRWSRNNKRKINWNRNSNSVNSLRIQCSTVQEVRKELTVHEFSKNNSKIFVNDIILCDICMYLCFECT